MNWERGAAAAVESLHRDFRAIRPSHSAVTPQPLDCASAGPAARRPPGSNSVLLGLLSLLRAR